MMKYFDAERMVEVTLERCLNNLYVKVQKVNRVPEPDKPKLNVYL